MGKNSNDSEKYWRSSIAIPTANKEAFLAKLAELGLKTTGDLASLVLHGEGVIEALKPAAQKFMAARETPGQKTELRKEVSQRLKHMTPEQIELLLAQLPKESPAQEPAVKTV
jgi:hypothetical protein